MEGIMTKPWRHDPRLRSRFHPNYPDDLQVIIHNGGPRFSQLPAEVVWVTVTEQVGDYYRGTLLNAPFNLPNVTVGDSILFLIADGVDHPIYVTEKYMAERGRWNITPCDKCGFSELFDAPSDLIAKVFPNAPSGGEMVSFTAFCPRCGGVQVAEHVDMSA
jgi:hypothetical protein